MYCNEFEKNVGLWGNIIMILRLYWHALIKKIELFWNMDQRKCYPFMEDSQRHPPITGWRIQPIPLFGLKVKTATSISVICSWKYIFGNIEVQICQEWLWYIYAKWKIFMFGIFSIADFLQQLRVNSSSSKLGHTHKKSIIE